MSASIAPPETAAAPPIPIESPPPAGMLALLRNRALTTLMLGHFTVDMYVGVIPMLYPLLTDKFGLSLSRVGFVSLAYSGMASLSQPFFGYLADRRGTRLIGLALMWTAISFSIIGFASSFNMLLLLAGLAGLGSGLYHPLGALNARAVIDEGQRNIAMSVYVTGGTLGVASGPIVGALLLHYFGLHGTALMIVPGVGIATFMLFKMGDISRRVVRRTRAQAAQAPPIPYAALAVVILMMMLRSWTISGLQTYVPVWFKELGHDSFFYSALVTTLLLATALGTIGSGTLADRMGRCFPLIVSSALSVPTILLFAQYPGRSSFLTIALIGFLAASTLPLLLVIAQELMVGRAGIASGLVMGIGFATSAVGVPVTGWVADTWGIQNAMRGQAIVGLASLAVALVLPTEAKIRAIAARGVPASPPSR